VRRAAAIATALVVLTAAAAPAGAAPGFAVRVSPVANLVYHLDCLSGYRRCTREAFDELWQRLDWSAEDERQLAAWRALQERYRLYADFTTPAPDTPYPYTFPYLQARGVDIGEKLRRLGVETILAPRLRERTYELRFESNNWLTRAASLVWNLWDSVLFIFQLAAKIGLRLMVL